MTARTMLKNNAALERWLGEHTWFEDAFAIRLDHAPSAANTPDSIRLVPTRTGVAFRIDVPGALEIVCGRLLIEAQAERCEQVPPWISDREFGATLPGRSVPPPEQWVAWFRTVGAEVCWRMYGGEARGEPADPRNYEGWYLQEPATIPGTCGGVFFFVCREREGALVLQWQRAETSDALWKAAQQVIALLEPAEAWCGNCRFSAEEWRRFVADGSLPVRLGFTAK